MNRTAVRILLRHELRMLMRDRRTVILSILLPLLIMPLIILGLRFSQTQRSQRLDETVYAYAVTGSEADRLRAWIARGRERAAALPPEHEYARLSRFKLEELPVAHPDSSLKNGDIHFYLEALSGAEADSVEARASRKPEETAANEGDTTAVGTPQRYPGVPVVYIYYRGNRDASNTGRRRMTDLLFLARTEERAAMLRQSGFPADPERVIPVESNDAATPEQATGALVGRLLTVMLTILMLTGGSVAAMDSISGEKERGSLETLLTTAVRRVEIVTAKQLAILTVALLITGIQVLNLLVYLMFEVIELPERFAIDVSPGMLVLLFVLYVPVAALVSSALLMISAYAKTYKETQFYYLPVFLIILTLSGAAFLPGVSLRSAVAFLPLANVSVAVREVWVGTYDWPMLTVTFAVMAGAAGWMIRMAARMLSMERLITASGADAAELAGGPALYPRHALLWYAAFWAILLIVNANIPALATFERQLLFNEFVIFFGGPALILWKYRLNVREALAIRPVRPVVWPVILVMIPAVQLTGAGVFYIANLIFPVPERVLEEFVRDILPEDMPLWQLFLYISIIPGVCEEIGFRGTLLYGLRRRFHPVALAFIIGAIFGVFHTTLFRIIPTGFLGVILTAVALTTGSIFPCMLLHAGNNAFAVWMSRQAFDTTRLAWWYYLAGALVFAGCLWLLYRYRTPYPGLRTARSGAAPE